MLKLSKDSLLGTVAWDDSSPVLDASEDPSLLSMLWRELSLIHEVSEDSSLEHVLSEVSSYKSIL